MKRIAVFLVDTYRALAFFFVYRPGYADVKFGRTYILVSGIELD